MIAPQEQRLLAWNAWKRMECSFRETSFGRILQRNGGNSLCFGPAEKTGNLHRHGSGIELAVFGSDVAAAILLSYAPGLRDLFRKGAADEIETVGGPRFSFLLGARVSND